MILCGVSASRPIWLAPSLSQGQPTEEIAFCILIPKPVLVTPVPGWKLECKALFLQQNCSWRALVCSSHRGKCSQLQLHSLSLYDSPALHTHNLNLTHHSPLPTSAGLPHCYLTALFQSCEVSLSPHCTTSDTETWGGYEPSQGHRAKQC